MPLTTYAEIQEGIQRALQRDDLAGHIPDFILMAESRLASVLIRNGGCREMETSATITISSGSGSLPTDYLAWRRVYANTTPIITLENVDPEWALLKYPSTDADTQKYFYIIGSTIFTKPVSSANLIMAYYQKIPALAANISGNWITSRAPQLYIYAACLEAAPFIDDDDRAAMWGSMLDRGVSELTTADISRFKGAVRLRGPVA